LLQESGRSSWERPLEYESPRFDGQMVVMSGNDGWTKHYDDANASYFYYNEVRAWDGGGGAVVRHCLLKNSALRSVFADVCMHVCICVVVCA
jgi:hypothetical protein